MEAATAFRTWTPTAPAAWAARQLEGCVPSAATANLRPLRS
jgi:hypothetical protein